VSVFAPAMSFLWENVRDLGIDPRALFIESGIDPKLRLDSSARVPESQIDNLLWNIKQQSKDEDFLFKMINQLHPSYLGALGYAWLTSPTLRKAFERLESYAQLINDSLEIRLSDERNELNVTTIARSVDVKDPALWEQDRLITPVRLCRMNYGESFSPSVVCFKQPKPSNIQLYHEYFRCDLVFN
jgi:hypothetical protein